jgi:hypothetical protein
VDTGGKVVDGSADSCSTRGRDVAFSRFEVEREVGWPDGSSSLYVCDPAGNSVELAPPSLWGGLGRAAVGEARAA